MRIGITGITGFIGARTAALAAAHGHEVTGFSRSAAAGPGRALGLRRFDPPQPPDLSGLDAVIHLAGEPVIGRWNAAKRHRILQSRVEGTRAVVRGFRTAGGPRVLVSASGVGIYGDTGDREVDESTPAGRGFLAEVAGAWEREAVRAVEDADARVSIVRIGFVLGANGGALARVLPLFRLGLGGRLGNGRQWMAPVHLDDVAALLLAAAEQEGFSGPYNACLPAPCTNAEFTRALARAVRRPAPFPVPAFALRLVLGDFASLLLSSCRVTPRRTLAAGFEFRHPTLEAALAECVGVRKPHA